MADEESAEARAAAAKAAEAARIQAELEARSQRVLDACFPHKPKK